MDPTDAAHVMQTPDEYADFLSGMSFEKRVEMLNSFRCAELQGAEELRVLSETTDDPDLARKFARHAADEEKHGAYFADIMRRLGVEPFDPPDEPDHITIGGRLIVDTLNDIEEILPKRGETVGLDRIIPVLTLFQAVESRALVSFEAHRRTFEDADPVIAERIARDHRRREPPRGLRPHAPRQMGRRGLGRRRAPGAGGHRRPRGLGPRVGGRAPRRGAPARRGRALGVVTGGPAERRERILASLVRAGAAGVSGEALAADLGCSRAAVHRHVEGLRREGVGIEGGHDGYRLGEDADPVVPMLVSPRLRPPVAGPVLWSPETGSTNDDVIAQARAGAGEGLVIGADRQSAGRGRRGRAWLAAPGHALLVSVLLRPDVPPVDAGLLPIVVAVAAAEALGPAARIVWPNDILVGGRKMAGILCEMSADQERVAWAVAGIGVNVRSAPALEDARWEAGALGDLGDPPARADLLVDAAVGPRPPLRPVGWRRRGGGARRVRRPRRPGRPEDHGLAGGRGDRGGRGRHRRPRAPAPAHARRASASWAPARSCGSPRDGRGY